MALINCPECKKKISETVGVCPKCGYDLKKDRDNKKKEELKEELKLKIISFFNKLKELILKYKYVLVGIVVFIVLIIISINIYNGIQEKIYEDNKSNHPDIKRIRNVIEGDLEDILKPVTIDGRRLEYKYNKKNLSGLELYEETDSQVLLKFKYHVEDSLVSFDIPLIVTYDFDGETYEYNKLQYLPDVLGTFKNVKINTCDVTKFLNYEGKSIQQMIEEKYKAKFDELKLVDTKEEGNNSCYSTYEVKKDTKYIDIDGKIDVKYNLLYNESSNKFFVNTTNDLNQKYMFDLVGKYSGKHEERGDYSNYKNSTFNFEIIKVDGHSLTLTNDGKIYEGKYDTYIQSSNSSYVDFSEYEDFFIFDVEFRWGSDGIGRKRNMQVRVYEDKLLYYCSYPKQNKTDGCFELKRN